MTVINTRSQQLVGGRRGPDGTAICAITAYHH